MVKDCGGFSGLGSNKSVIRVGSRSSYLRYVLYQLIYVYLYLSYLNLIGLGIDMVVGRSYVYIIWYRCHLKVYNNIPQSTLMSIS